MATLRGFIGIVKSSKHVCRVLFIYEKMRESKIRRICVYNLGVSTHLHSETNRIRRRNCYVSGRFIFEITRKQELKSNNFLQSAIF